MTARDRKKTAGEGRGRNSSVVAATLRNKILRLDLKPGEAIDEVALATEFGVSRTPMREALIRLAGEYLVELTPNRGARVTSINLHDIRELFEVLEVIQGVATRWAALRREDREVTVMRDAAGAFHRNIQSGEILAAVQSNYDFHVSIARAAKNSLLEAQYSSLLSRTFRLGIITLAQSPLCPAAQNKDVESIESEHEDLVAAIEEQNGAGAEVIARRHARQFLLRVTRYMNVNLADETAAYEPHLDSGTASHPNPLAVMPKRATRMRALAST